MGPNPNMMYRFDANRGRTSLGHPRGDVEPPLLRSCALIEWATSF